VKLDASVRLAMAVVLACAVTVAAGDDKKDKKPKSGSQLVDSGSFGVFIKGQRVVSETFSVQQDSDHSTVKSQLKETSGATPTDQKSQLEMTTGGVLIRYQWSQAAGGSLEVLPNNDFLIERISTPQSSKPAEQPFLMPSTSIILDNNFFIQREVMAWRYLATAPCKGDSVKRQCEPVEFGALVPQDRNSMRVRMELVGKEKVTIRGAEQELLRLKLSGDGFEWALWLDDHDQFKLIRVSIPADNTEVVRD
jgi:hypothetical protein